MKTPIRHALKADDWKRKFWRSTLLLAGMGLILTMFGCAQNRCTQQGNIVIINSDGNLVDRTSGRVIPNCQNQSYFEPIRNTNMALGKDLDIVIFIQGGNTTINSGIDRANKLTTNIMQDPRTPAYPIFVAWDADLFHAYGNHLVKVHRGKTDRWTAGALLPLTFVADAGRLFSEAPISLAEQAWAGVRTAETGHYSSKGKKGPTNNHSMFPETDVNDALLKLKATMGDRVTLGTNSPKACFAGRGTLMTLKAFQNAFPDAIVDTAGKIGWDQMLRVTKTMFTEATNNYPIGGMEVFCRQLTNYLSKPENANKHVILIGHSMGAIIATEMIRRHGDRLHLSHIVFLAAAVGGDEFNRGVVPFLKRHHEVMFHNVCLHPGNDSGEAYYYFGKSNGVGALAGVIAPQGSLLDWIDYYYSSTETDFGRTMGKWENAILELESIIDYNDSTGLRDRITIKAFGMGDQFHYGPQHHGDFGNVRFWDHRIWEPVQWNPDLWIQPP